MNGITRAQQNAERDSLRGLRPSYLQRKAQEYLMEHPNATWIDFSNHIIQKDVSFQVSSNFLNDEEQTKAELASLGQEMKNLRMNCKNIELMLWKALPNLWTQTKKEDKTLLDFLIIAAQMDTLPVGAGRKNVTKS